MEVLMGPSQVKDCALSKTFPSPKITAVEQTLTQSLINFKELVVEFEQLHLENIKYRKNEKLESQTCCHCDEMKKIIDTKEQNLNSIVSILNKLMQTKDFSLIDAILLQIHDETSMLTPPGSVSPQKVITPNKSHQNPPQLKQNKIDTDAKIASPKKIVEDICKDESVSEIEGTPTGRKSPIFEMRKSKSNMIPIMLKDKKKCPESWPTPEKKSIKLTYPSPTTSKSKGRLRQGRLNLVKLKSSNVVDLTCSPEIDIAENYEEPILQCNVKSEIIDNDETILPSPTSGPVKFSPLHKIMLKNSPTKFKKPSTLAATVKIESNNRDWNIENKMPIAEDMRGIEDSINLLNQLPNRFKSPIKREIMDETHYENDSISLLNNLKRAEAKSNRPSSPSKRLLIENVNITNVNHQNESSMSILQKDVFCKAIKINNIPKRVKEVAPVYREPAPRTKAEKRSLPGWSCDDCKNFFDELYKDNLEMLAQKMNECSKHRGQYNPLRPKTPEGFWNPRWDVPEDTEEFNRRNNV